jgi:hypothetical protein
MTALTGPVLGLAMLCAQPGNGPTIPPTIDSETLRRALDRIEVQPIPPVPHDFRGYRAASSAKPFRWENVPWATLGIVGVVIFAGAMAVGFCNARWPG